MQTLMVWQEQEFMTILHPDWRQDVDILVNGAGEKLAYITLPKSTCYEDAKTQIEYIQAVAKKAGIKERFQFTYL